MYPFERDRPTEKLLDYFPLSYTMEFGNVYEKSAHQCSLCHYNREGLICCGMCKDLDLPEPTLMHATCAKAIGYKMELRNFPRVASLVCDRHADYIVDKGRKKWTLPISQRRLEGGEKRDNAFANNNTIDSDDPDSVLPPLQIGEQVELIEEETESETDEEETKQVRFKDEEGRMKKEKGSCRGRVEDIEWVPYAVLDFMDGTVSRDIPSNDIVEHSCDDCTPPMHTAGAVLKVRWSDNTIYEAYFRGMIATRDYRVQMQDGSIRLFQRKNLKSLSEMEEASQMVSWRIKKLKFICPF
ncbi:hypothetical protein WR25_18373 [Diploscapter pachys]|uniref:PHD-type domain-containing protein n=1 Tax=Diploscapter pachys TaxID=2018661 RepID=A0A2A2JZ20_9BILA|nr:hypothetical protein WR25_18373 [Diploscapter pachys]